MAETRIYVCNLYRELQIGAKIKFKDGKFMTDDPVLQQQIESRGEFGASIHYQDGIEEMAREGRRIREEESALRASRRKALMDEVDKEEKEAAEAAKKEKAAAATEEKKKEGEHRIAEADAKDKAEKEKADKGAAAKSHK